MKVQYKKVSMNEHALKRAEERFNIDKSKALGYFRGVLAKAKYVGLVEDRNGHSNHLFAHGRMAIVLSPDKTLIKTVYKEESLSYDPLKEKVVELHKKKFNNYSRKLSARERCFKQLQLETNLELAELNLRIHKTRSKAVELSCKARIKAIQQHIDDCKAEIIEIQSEKRRIAKSMVSIL